MAFKMKPPSMIQGTKSHRSAVSAFKLSESTVSLEKVGGPRDKSLIASSKRKLKDRKTTARQELIQRTEELKQKSKAKNRESGALGPKKVTKKSPAELAGVISAVGKVAKTAGKVAGKVAKGAKNVVGKVAKGAGDAVKKVSGKVGDVAKKAGKGIGKAVKKGKAAREAANEAGKKTLGQQAMSAAGGMVKDAAMTSYKEHQEAKNRPPVNPAAQGFSDIKMGN